ncbi:MAG: hypothetical protein WCP87_01640, partial [Atribacterota bacterium]
MSSTPVNDKLMVGIDIGGTKTGVALLNFQGEVIQKKYFPTEYQRGERNLIERIIECFETLLDLAGSHTD